MPQPGMHLDTPLFRVRSSPRADPGDSHIENTIMARPNVEVLYLCALRFP